MNDDLTLLASAYLDGDVTADERARVGIERRGAADGDRRANLRHVAVGTNRRRCAGRR